MVNQSRGGRPGHGQLAGIEHREDVGMLEPGGEVDLAEKALGAHRGGELGVEHLDRDRPVVLEVAGEPDGGHAPAAELALERVAVPQTFAQRRAGSDMGRLERHAVPSTSFRNRGWSRTGSNMGSIRIHAGVSVYGIASSGSSRSRASSFRPASR